MTKTKSALVFLVMALVIGIGLSSLPQTVNAQTDKKQEREDKDDEKLSPEDAKKVKISMEEAKTIALKKVSGTILESELEKEKQKIIYSFDIRDQNGKIFDVEVDAITGDVLQAEEDDKDKDNDADDTLPSIQTKKKNIFVRTANSVKNTTVKAVGKIF